MATRSLWCPTVFILLLVGDGWISTPAWAQTTTPPTTSTSSQQQNQAPPPSLPVDLSRIKEGLSAPVTIKLDDGKVRFYSKAEAPEGKTFSELSVNFDLKNGPVPGAGMTHQEFLGMVTPKLRYTSGIGEQLKVLAWGVAEAGAFWGVRKLYQELQETKDERRKEELRKQIDRELAAIKAAGGGGGGGGGR